MERTKCEVYSRVVGYLRPVEQWNSGKRSEFAQRKAYKMENVECVPCASAGSRKQP